MVVNMDYLREWNNISWRGDFSKISRVCIFVKNKGEEASSSKYVGYSLINTSCECKSIVENNFVLKLSLLDAFCGFGSC